MKQGEKIKINYTDFNGYPNVIRIKNKNKKFEVLHQMERENRFVGTIQLTKMVGQNCQFMLNDS